MTCVVAACHPSGRTDTEEVATTIPARTSATAGEDAGASDRDADAQVVLGGDHLADPAALTLEDLGYAGTPTPLPASAERRHAMGHLALNERRFARAAAAFTAVLAEHPDSAQDYYDLAQALAGSGAHARAADALAAALVREFPHLWSRYSEDSGLEGLRTSDQHARLEALAHRLRRLHADARVAGAPATVRWAPGVGVAGAQAGVRLEGRFVPLAPRVWTTSAVADARLVVDAIYDHHSGRVLNVHATVHGELDRVAVEVHDATYGRRLGRGDVETGAGGIEIDPAPRTVRVRAAGGRWRDLRGRPVRHADADADAEQVGVVAVDLDGMRRLEVASLPQAG